MATGLSRCPKEIRQKQGDHCSLRSSDRLVCLAARSCLLIDRLEATLYLSAKLVSKLFVVDTLEDILSEGNA